MLATKLPPDLWREFEQQAQKLYDDQDSVTKLAGVAESLQETNQYAIKAKDRIVYRVGENRPREVKVGWQMAFD